MTSFSDDNVFTEVENIVNMLQNSPFIMTGVTNLDGTYAKNAIDVPTEVFEKVASKVLLQCPQGSFMLIGVGPKSCAIFALSNSNQLFAGDWINAATDSKALVHAEWNSPKAKDSHDNSKYTAAAATLAVEYPIKQKDCIISNACSYLRKLNLLLEEEEFRPDFDFNA